MNDTSKPFFSEGDLRNWVRDRRAALAVSVRNTSAPGARLLKAARLTPVRILAAAAREVRDPDWRAGFVNRCTIVVRPEWAEHGRLGLWNEGATLCVEAQIGSCVLVLRGRSGELRLSETFPETVASALVGRRVRDVVQLEALSGCSGRITAVMSDQVAGTTVLRFRTGSRSLALKPRRSASVN